MLQGEVFEDIRLDDLGKPLQFFKRQLIQFPALLQRHGHGLAHDGVGLAEGHPFTHQVIGHVGGVEVAAAGRLPHAVGIDLDPG